jgi:PAS domain S-box-containing protein
VVRGKAATRSFRIDGNELPRLLVEEVRDYAIMVVDTKKRVQMWNPGAEQMLGFREREMLGKSASVIFTPEDRAAGVDDDEIQTARTKGRAEDERWHLRKNQERFWGSGVMTRLNDAEGKLIGFVKLLRDHTERKRLEDQTKQMNELLERRVGERTEELVRQQSRLRELALETTNAEQRARDAIAADLHDNLAQIMAVCLMKLAVAQKGFPATKAPAEYVEAVECVREVLRQLRVLMYDLSPMTFGDGQLRPAIEWVKERMASHGLEVTIRDQTRGLRLHEDVLRVIYRAVQELLWNVVKHARVNRATVQLTRTKNTLRATVRDKGRGFNPNRISKASETGGFGLFSLRERLAALGGSMTVKSSRGKGTEITIEAPVKVK